MTGEVLRDVPCTARQLHMAVTDAVGVGRARRELRRLLDAQADRMFDNDILLATSEVLSNAVQYTPGPVELHAWYDPPDGRARVEVVDRSAWAPMLPHAAEPDAPRGRGLSIVDSVTSRWGVEPVPNGKRVWFEISR